VLPKPAECTVPPSRKAGFQPAKSSASSTIQRSGRASFYGFASGPRPIQTQPKRSVGAPALLSREKNGQQPEAGKARLTGTRQLAFRKPRRGESLRLSFRPLAAYDTAEKIGWNTCIAVTGGKWPNSRGERSSPNRGVGLLAYKGGQSPPYRNAPARLPESPEGASLSVFPSGPSPHTTQPKRSVGTLPPLVFYPMRWC